MAHYSYAPMSAPPGLRPRSFDLDPTPQQAPQRHHHARPFSAPAASSAAASTGQIMLSTTGVVLGVIGVLILGAVLGMVIFLVVRDDQITSSLNRISSKVSQLDQEEQQEAAACDLGLQEAYFVLFFSCPLNDSILYRTTLIGSVEAVMPQIDAILVAIRPSQWTLFADLPCFDSFEYMFGPGNYGTNDGSVLGETPSLMRSFGRVVTDAVPGGVNTEFVGGPLPRVDSFTDSMEYFIPFWDHAIMQVANQVR